MLCSARAGKALPDKVSLLACPEFGPVGRARIVKSTCQPLRLPLSDKAALLDSSRAIASAPGPIDHRPKLAKRIRSAFGPNTQLEILQLTPSLLRTMGWLYTTHCQLMRPFI